MCCLGRRSWAAVISSHVKQQVTPAATLMVPHQLLYGFVQLPSFGFKYGGQSHVSNLQSEVADVQCCFVQEPIQVSRDYLKQTMISLLICI
jgi:hypothetical protein